jgi:hypothetical protein
MYIALHLSRWVPERVRRVFPTSSKHRDIQPENELVSLIVEGQK